MKMFRSFTATLLATVMMITLCTSQVALAATSKANNGTAVTKEEVAESLARSKGITYAEVFIQLTDSENKLFMEKGVDKRRRAASVSYQYYTVEKQLVPALLKLNAWAYVQVYNQGSFREFIEIVDTGSGQVGLSLADWDPHGFRKLDYANKAGFIISMIMVSPPFIMAIAPPSFSGGAWLDQYRSHLSLKVTIPEIVALPPNDLPTVNPKFSRPICMA